MVKFPTLSDEVVSAPARLVSFDAGNGRGTLFIPEVNDEVLVAFEHGDTRRPVILGSLWNSNDKVPTLKDGGVTGGEVRARVIRTRLGHALTFNDGTDDASKNVNILLADGSTSVLLSHEKIVISNSKLPISITNTKASIDFTDAGDITIKGEAITIDGKSVTITAKEALTAKGKDVTVDAGAGLTLTGKGPSKLESKAALTIKGSMVSIN
jgi:uncharacterized protein involved in type VI secretion and phage assembly